MPLFVVLSDNDRYSYNPGNKDAPPVGFKPAPIAPSTNSVKVGRPSHGRCDCRLKESVVCGGVFVASWRECACHFYTRLCIAWQRAQHHAHRPLQKHVLPNLGHTSSGVCTDSSLAASHMRVAESCLGGDHSTGFVVLRCLSTTAVVRHSHVVSHAQ